MDEKKFVVDRMLGRLVTWLRILGYDTLYIKDVRFIFKEEDDLLLLISKSCNRILVTRDRALSQRARRYGLDYHYMRSDKVMEQLGELSLAYGMKLEPKMIRCSICNNVIRHADLCNDKRLLESDYVPKWMIEDGADFWICDRCGKVYWQGSHWDNMRRALRGLENKLE
ncbi:MAG: Mut7-C RNAse domain-containing protein [Halobacteriota archaeon]|nr:Mut7-C RNAse domain-containing protein [Halobacteriota archaeon]